MALTAGDVVAGYTVEAVLGHGGMGTVYRVRHPALPRSDALKVLSEQLSQDSHFRARFAREAELAATLDHPNIVTVYNRGESDGQVWIAMQYVAGSDADKELIAGRMSPQRAVHVIGEVAKALEYAHRKGVLHRDVKPANFLLAPDDERVFLADFGIARALDEVAGMTQTGMVMASIAYASPESLTGEPVDHRSDVYSLGCSLYRLLTGQAPYARSGGMAAAAAAHLVEPPPRATDIVASLPAAFDAVIATAMAKDPAQRYQSAPELAHAAARALDETTDAHRHAVRPPGAPPAAWTTPPAAQQSYPAGAETAPSTRQPAPPSSGPPPPPSADQSMAAAFTDFTPTPARTPRRRRLLVAAAAAAVVVLVAAVVGFVTLGGDSDSAPPFRAQTLAHEFGQTELTAAPNAVAALGLGDGDAVLSLGVQLAAVYAAGGALPSWEQALVTNQNLRVLADAAAPAVAAANPDLIIDTGVINAATYSALQAVAPTITRPSGAGALTWQARLQWIARILERDDDASRLLDNTSSALADLRTQHPAFSGKSIRVVYVTDTGISVALAQSGAARYLEELGFRYPSDLGAAGGGDQTEQTIPEALLNDAPTDVRLIVRSDRGAGNGSYNGLPQPFSAFRGATIIVDDPDTVTALRVPGYAATQYLNTTLVDQLARQVR
ncbi:serine/threonine-protein kinase [Mycolicibacterium obuense]|uniref:non-specific serine/threonine protein kinase n=1 Tax=Mycolicibacterium obuense TaxID=1807 RepID=A0A0M2JQH9_9MYCO|nr:serine/threonine-protein kinase [Mycolicibacterium obuense]KKE99201.1 serine/threonine protein kinase [Mycolicibacterium obuense]